MKDKLNIKIKIAELAPLSMIIKPEEEVTVRKAEESVNHLWSLWKARFEADPDQLMAMVAFQFAKLFTVMKEREMQTLAALDNFEKEIVSLTAAIDGIDLDSKSKANAAPGPADHPSLL